MCVTDSFNYCYLHTATLRTGKVFKTHENAKSETDYKLLIRNFSPLINEVVL